MTKQKILLKGATVKMLTRMENATDKILWTYCDVMRRHLSDNSDTLDGITYHRNSLGRQSLVNRNAGKNKDNKDNF